MITDEIVEVAARAVALINDKRRFEIRKLQNPSITMPEPSDKAWVLFEEECRAALQAAAALDTRAGVEDSTVARKIKLWFFRDMSSEQRLKLFSLFGMPIDEIGDVHGMQNIALRHILSALASPPAPVAEPVLWQRWSDTFGWVELLPDEDRSLYTVRPLYAAPLPPGEAE